MSLSGATKQQGLTCLSNDTLRVSVRTLPVSPLCAELCSDPPTVGGSGGLALLGVGGSQVPAKLVPVASSTAILPLESCHRGNTVTCTSGDAATNDCMQHLSGGCLKLENCSQWCHPGQSDCAASHGACPPPLCPLTLLAGGNLMLPGHVLSISVVLAASVVSFYWRYLTSLKVLLGRTSQ